MDRMFAKMRWLVGLFLALASTGGLRAERFLDIAEAQKICFPDADRFEARVIRFTPEQAKAVQQHSKVKVLNKGNRIWIAWRGRQVLGVLLADHVLGKHEVIDYVVGVNPSGQVLRVEILAYRESYGGEIRGARWREQFKGKSPSAPLRLNEDIYNISGATISCRNVSEGVRRVLATFEQVVRPALADVRGGDDGLQGAAR